MASQCEIEKEIEPVFDDLSKLELLQKCTHGLTQNYVLINGRHIG
jgi:hypothetical protein